jgi:hypothetical protein
VDSIFSVSRFSPATNSIMHVLIRSDFSSSSSYSSTGAVSTKFNEASEVGKQVCW